MNATKALKIAEELVGGQASVHIHDGHHHTAIRVTGTDYESGVRLAMRIERAVLGPRDEQSGQLPMSRSLGLVTEAQFVAVWIS
ncbi:MAG: hypothetical protein ACLP1Y_05065 [Candidatus Acidiferrales bacterium]